MRKTSHSRVSMVVTGSLATTRTPEHLQTPYSQKRSAHVNDNVSCMQKHHIAMNINAIRQ